MSRFQGGKYGHILVFLAFRSCNTLEGRLVVIFWICTHKPEPFAMHDTNGKVAVLCWMTSVWLTSEIYSHHNKEWILNNDPDIELKSQFKAIVNIEIYLKWTSDVYIPEYFLLFYLCAASNAVPITVLVKVYRKFWVIIFSFNGL